LLLFGLDLGEQFIGIGPDGFDGHGLNILRIDWGIGDFGLKIVDWRRGIRF
jgi:hypothetical protein